MLFCSKQRHTRNKNLRELCFLIYSIFFFIIIIDLLLFLFLVTWNTDRNTKKEIGVYTQIEKPSHYKSFFFVFFSFSFLHQNSWHFFLYILGLFFSVRFFFPQNILIERKERRRKRSRKRHTYTADYLLYRLCVCVCVCVVESIKKETKSKREIKNLILVTNIKNKIFDKEQRIYNKYVSYAKSRHHVC